MRKNIFLLAMPLILFSTYLMATPPLDPNDSLRVKLDNVFSPINKTLIPTGFLEEYAYPFIPLDLFNNTLTDSSRTNMNIWRTLYATLYSAKIYGTNTLPRLDTINARLNAAMATSASIPIVMIRLDYSTLRPDAISANLLRVQNNQLYDVAGRTQSPYVQKTLFAASPARSYSDSSKVSFVLQQKFYPQNNSKVVNLLSIDFGDGRGYQTTWWNYNISTNYTTKGTKRIKVRITYADGEIVQSHFDMEVRQAACPNCRFGDPRDNYFIRFPAKLGIHSGGKAYVQYGGNYTKTKINKPLIVAEGYDGSSAAPDLVENFTIRDFLALINPLGSFDFRNALENIAQYDIIFIDYNNGTDDIRRNAALFQEVVAWVNANKVADAQGVMQQNVVMGISMGGLVARYGLAKMEKTLANSSQTRLLITHDSPHRGANTPLGLQYLTRLSANIDLAARLSPTNNLVDWWQQTWVKLRQANKLLDEPATKQLLIIRATNSLGGYENNTFLDGEYRSMITFNGTQPNYRTIATSLGSQCGIGSLTPSSQLLQINASFFLDPLPWIIRHKTKSQIIVNALPPQGQSKRITYMKIWFDYKIFSFININVTLVNYAINSPANLLPLDGLAGGTSNVKVEAGSDIPNVYYNGAGFIELSLNAEFAGDFCYLPTVSALDIADINATTVQGKYVGGVASVSTARVANFIAQGASGSNPTNYNFRHPRFNARNSEWLFNEMEKTVSSLPNTLNCASECNPYAGLSIIGNGSVCGNTLYSITAISGAAYTWAVSSNLLIVSGQGTNAVTVKPNGSGSGTIGLTLGRNGCAFPVPSLPVQMIGFSDGQLNVTMDGGAALQMCPNSSYYLSASGPTGTTFSNWSMQGDFTYQSLSGSGGRVNTGPNFGGGAAVLRATDACGTTTDFVRSIQRPSTCSGSFLVVSPNPAQDQINIEPIAANTSLADTYTSLDKASSNTLAPVSKESLTVQLRILDKTMRLRYSTSSTGTKWTLSVRNLPSDLYYLQVVFPNGEISSTKILVQH